MPIELTVSVGYVICDADSDKSIDVFVNMADDRMYEDKVSRKMNRRD
jgi:GGDEF domain-containing protein